MLMPTDSIGVRSLCLELRDFLSHAKHAVDEEIRAYPTPIPRCDAQFNHLYEQRSRVARMLDRANDALDHDDVAELAATIAEFAAAPPIVDSVAEQRLRERTRVALASGQPAPASAAPADATP